MQITLTNTGKRFNREWIFRHLSMAFEAPGKYAITGPNGSGKSTLLQVIAGAVAHNEGSVIYQDGAVIAAEHHFQQVAIAAPYLELIEEMTALELLQFHARFKPLLIPAMEALQYTGLAKAATKEIRYYSSGMKQRLKLAQAFFSNTPVLLLDEPTSNLDAEGISLYHQLIKAYTLNRLVIISSNDENEYGFCEAVIRITEYK
ncbi:MAG TPA: ABC transporter ATP-binding protein [Ferruginibacter sp.]|nr:ABC transporter ATP-binding protein [Ferruginibacter sp.]HMP20691.1 ABC transporter ATP-binding protein [Ferruginibacter sp.]